MKKQMLFLAVALCALLSGCKKESERALVEAVVMPPATEIFAPGAPISIGGTGFTASDQIILRPAPTKAEGDLLATITEVTATGITFTFPTETPAGVYSVILRRNGVELVLGSITVVRPRLIKELNYKSLGSSTYIQIDTYQYDPKNRITNYTWLHRGGTSLNDSFEDSFNAQCTYEPDLIHVQVEYEGKTHQLPAPLDNEGRILELDLQSFSGRAKVNLTYNTEGGVKEVQKQYEESSNVYLTEYTWESGNMTKSVRKASGHIYSEEFEYSDIPNKTNLDGMELIGKTLLGYSTGINTGLKSKFLVSAVKSTYIYTEGYERKEEYKYAYKLDAAGYPIKITQTRVDSSPYNYDDVTEISYTK